MRDIAGRTDGRGVSGQDLDRAARDATGTSPRRRTGAGRALARIGPREEEIAGARAQVASAQAQLALLQHQIDQGHLVAPSDGVVRSRLLQPGDQATPQKPVFNLALTHPKWVRVYVPEPDLGRIRMGLPAKVTTDSMPGQCLGRIGYISSVSEFTPKSVETETCGPASSTKCGSGWTIRATTCAWDNR
jgi:HlyD family secretion protein